MDKLKLIYIIGTYPSLTTTFIDREIRLLREWGVRLQIVSIRRTDNKLSAEQEKLRDGVIYILPVIIASLIAGHLRFFCLQPKKYVGTLYYLLTRPHPTVKSRLKTLLHFGEGVYTAHVLRQHSFDHIHAHFVDRATVIALIVSRLLNVPYSATAHANDIYVDPVLLSEKMAEAKFVATCTNYNKSYLAGTDGAALDKLHCIYHGLDLDNYQPQPRAMSHKPMLISVGQLREKKGFAFLLKACRLLRDRGYEFDCQIIGDGPLRSTLEDQIRQLTLEDTVTLCGALPHERVIEKYKQATIFVLPCVTGHDGARDGIPNVILEAMALELPVVSTQHSGIPEVVREGLNGLLVPPADEAALADALAQLLDDPHSGKQYGQKGRQTVREVFSVENNVKQLLAQFTA